MHACGLQSLSWASYLVLCCLLTCLLVMNAEQRLEKWMTTSDSVHSRSPAQESYMWSLSLTQVDLYPSKHSHPHPASACSLASIGVCLCFILILAAIFLLALIVGLSLISSRLSFSPLGYATSLLCTPFAPAHPLPPITTSIADTPTQTNIKAKPSTLDQVPSRRN